MPVALISDIHGNLEALQAALADCRSLGVGKIVCLGDMIGYGPDPQAVLDCLRDEGIVSIMGNHELGVAFRKQREWFNPLSRKTLLLTASLLSRESLRYIARLPKFIAHLGFHGVHGYPPASLKTYLFKQGPEVLREWFSGDGSALVFVGHTHDLEVVGWDGFKVMRAIRQQGVLPLVHKKYIVSVGSVGQPRDGDNRAKYTIWNETRRNLETRYVAYDFEATIAKMQSRGFPERYARKLR